MRVETINDRTWKAVVPPSYDGFRAVMIEVSFSGPDDRSKVNTVSKILHEKVLLPNLFPNYVFLNINVTFQLTFTSEVMITPDSRPFEKCTGTGCYGYLV